MGYRPGLVIATVSINSRDTFGKSLPSVPVPLAIGETNVTATSLMLDVPASTLLGQCVVRIDGEDVGNRVTLSYAQLDVVSADGATQLMAFTASTPAVVTPHSIHFDDPGSGATAGTDLSMTGDGIHITSAAGGRYQFQVLVVLDYDR